MKACLFLGPSLDRVEVPDHITVFPPVVLGSVFHAVEAEFELIGIVDGMFGNVPTVWHKEILYALSNSVTVAGAASMGALRAAELDRFGMMGVGRAYRLFKSGALTDDDEVCVAHSPPELGNVALTEAMLNVRYTLRRLQRRRLISKTESHLACKRLKEMFFAGRTRDQVLQVLCETVGPRRASPVCDAYIALYDDVKADDARRLIRQIPDIYARGPPVIDWVFPRSFHWQNAFESEMGELPPLESSAGE